MEIARLVTEADPSLLVVRNQDPGSTPVAAVMSNSECDSIATLKYLLGVNPMIASIPDDFGCLPLHMVLCLSLIVVR